MNLIVAVTRDYAIGKNNDLLFHLPSDLAYFKSKTLDKVVVMGERTYLSLPKRPLPKRTNIVLSNNPEFSAEGAFVVRSLDELFAKLKEFNTDDIFVSGGASIYNLLMPYCAKAYVTMVDASVLADTYIHDVEKEGFVLEDETLPQEENGLKFTFRIYRNPNVKKF